MYRPAVQIHIVPPLLAYFLPSSLLQPNPKKREQFKSRMCKALSSTSNEEYSEVTLRARAQDTH